MKSAFGWFVFGMVVALACVTEALLTCYECIHTETKETIDGYESTCAEPFVPDGIDTCTGTACIIMWHDFGSMGYGNNRSCYIDPPPGSVDQCLMMNHFQKTYTFFFYRELCCFSANNTITHNGVQLQFQSTVCVCDKEKCNGNIPNYVTTPAPAGAQPTGGNIATGQPTTLMSSGNWMNLSQPLLAAALLVTNLMTYV